LVLAYLCNYFFRFSEEATEDIFQEVNLSF